MFPPEGTCHERQRLEILEAWADRGDATAHTESRRSPSPRVLHGLLSVSLLTIRDHARDAIVSLPGNVSQQLSELRLASWLKCPQSRRPRLFAPQAMPFSFPDDYGYVVLAHCMPWISACKGTGDVHGSKLPKFFKMRFQKLTPEVLDLQHVPDDQRGEDLRFRPETRHGSSAFSTASAAPCFEKST